MNKNPTLVQRISNNIIDGPISQDFSIIESFNSIPEKYGTKLGFVMERYVHHWLSSNNKLQRITTQGAYEDRVSQHQKKFISISEEGDDFFHINPDGTLKMSFDGLYLCSGVNIPIEVKSGNLNGYLKHLDVVQNSFYSMFGKGSFIHPVFFPLRKETSQFVIPKLEKAIAKFPELTFIDISDFVHNTQLVQQELTGSNKKLKEPYQTQTSKRTYISKKEETIQKRGKKSKKTKRWT